MAKWNPFENTILKADPDEFARQAEESGYGVPHDADQMADENPGMPQDGPRPEDEGLQEGAPDALTPDPAPAESTEDNAFGQTWGADAGHSPVDGNGGETAGTFPGAEETGSFPGSEAAGTFPGAEETSSFPGSGAAGSFPGAEETGSSGEAAGGNLQEGAPEGLTPDPAPEGSTQDSAFGQPEGAPSGSVPPFGPEHDFEDDEPKFDTQTGEPLDKPKKKLPAILLTAAVTALAVGAFIYSVKPGALPSRRNVEEKEEEETETRLAIAAPESETEAESGPRGDEKAPQTETEKAGEVLLSTAGKGAASETETENLTEAGTETEAESENGTEQIPEGIPQFTTDGVTVSASLDVADLVEEAMPGVVSVTATSVQTVRDFFYGLQEIRQTDAGSGIIVDRDDSYLYIITDAAIVSGAQDVTVGFCVEKDKTKELSDDDTISFAEVMGMDEESLLAVIRVPVDEIHETVLSLVRTAALGDSDTIRVGERVVAIGNAMGRGLSVTQGIVSAVGRQMRYGSAVHDFIQTDASINYGNYGGALVNEAGEVIGINAGKITDNASEGMGFAFPVNEAKEAIGRMLGVNVSGSETASGDAGDGEKKDQKEQRETLALALASDDSETQAAETQAPETQTPETQAPKTQVPETQTPETQAAETQPALTQTEAAGKAAQTEDGKEQKEADSSQGQLGVQAGEFSKEDQIIYRIPAGVVIADVVAGSGAQTAGLVSGDLVTGINEEKVGSVDELKAALSGKKSGDKVKVSFIRPDENNTYDMENEMSVTVTLQ